MTQFLHALQMCFAPSQFDDSQGAFFNLTQTTTVHDYQSQFESLSNRVVGLPHNFLLSSFISGLKPPICREVQALEYINLLLEIDLVLPELNFSEIQKC